VNVAYRKRPKTNPRTGTHQPHSISHRLLAVWPITKGLFFKCNIALRLYVYVVLGPWVRSLSSHFPLSLLGHSPMHRVTVSSTRNQSWKTDERETSTQTERERKKEKGKQERKRASTKVARHTSKHYTTRPPPRLAYNQF
jgi:hypothetical protein